MSLATYSFVTYDNPLTLIDCCLFFIVRNIEHFATQGNISDKTFYLWKDGVSLSNGTLEQFFQVTIKYRGEIDARWITLFLGSRFRARQFLASLSSPDRSSAIDHPNGVTGYSPEACLSNLKDEIETKKLEPTDEFLEHSVKKLQEERGRILTQVMPLDESEMSSVTLAGDSVKAVSNEDKTAINSTSIHSNINPNSEQQVSATVSLYGTRERINYFQRTPSFFKNRTETNAGVRYTTIDFTGILKRLVIPRNCLMPAPELLACLLKYSEPFEIMLEDCSNLDSKLEALELIAAHFSRVITLKLYRCGSLLTQCFECFSAASPLSSRAMEQLAAGLDLPHLRVLALRDMPATAFSSNECLLLEQLTDRLSTHLLQLDLSGADFSCSASFDWLSRLRHLRVLLLANCQMPSDRAPLIAAICSLPDLIQLDIAHFGGQYLDKNPEYDGPIRVCFNREGFFTSTF